MKERIWVDVNSANDWVNELLGHELHQTKIDSLTKQNVYSIKLSVVGQLSSSIEINRSQPSSSAWR